MARQMFSLRFLCGLLALLLLGGCGHTPVSRTLFDAIPGLSQKTDQIVLNPSLSYLRVTVRGRVVLMVLGYVDPHADGPIETWYSSQGEVIRLQNGRIVATAGLETDWRAVRSVSRPAWQEMLGRKTAEYRRERDEMPGYRFGISERISVAAVRPPFNARLVGWPAQDLRWFEETVLDDPKGLPSARYGLGLTDGLPRVIYGEQCLSSNLCIAWQTWPAPK